MGFLSSGLFIGTLVVLFGIFIILKAVFHIDIPVFRIIIGLLLIYWGIRFITGSFWRWNYRYHSDNTVVFDHHNMRYAQGRRDYNIVFGNGNVDLGMEDTLTENRMAEVNVVFGNGRVRVNRNTPTVIEMNAAFGNAIAPDRNSSAFGNLTYTSPAYNAGKPYLFVRANVVFGKLEIVEY